MDKQAALQLPTRSHTIFDPRHNSKFQRQHPPQTLAFHHVVSSREGPWSCGATPTQNTVHLLLEAEQL